MPRKCLLHIVPATSGVTFLAWTGWFEREATQTFPSVHLAWYLSILHTLSSSPQNSLRLILFSSLPFALCFCSCLSSFRPLTAMSSDRLDLQDCLEHGRTAKVKSLTAKTETDFHPVVKWQVDKFQQKHNYNPHLFSSLIKWGPSPLGRIP